VRELHQRLEDNEERHVCKICYEREINTVLLDCYHAALCTRCVQQVTHCPICRAPKRKSLETFLA